MSNNLSLLKILVRQLHSEIDSIAESMDDLIVNEPVNLNHLVREYETKIIKEALVKAGGNQRKAAKMLGIGATTLNYKIKCLDIDFLKFISH